MKAAIRGESRGSLPVSRLRGWLVPAYLLVLLLVAGALFQPTGALAVSFSVSIDTSMLSGTPAQLGFDFIDGDATNNNSATISLFVTDGSLGGSSTTGGVSGIPPNVTLADTSFFNELLQTTTLGTSIAFMLDLTTNPPVFPGIPDGFSVFILDATGASSLVTTDLPGDALFVASSDGSVLVAGTTSPSVPTSVTAVPGPSALLLSVLGLAAISLRGIRRRPRQPTSS